MNDSKKTIIYIDSDDEITTIIDKLTSSDTKIVAAVLPKRAPMLQSLTNMKLLKKAADDSKKSLVIITSEKSLLPLAGAAKLHVASTPTSKPVIPRTILADESTIDAGEVSGSDPSLDRSATVGALAAAAVTSDVETIELDNTLPEEEAPVAAAKPNKKFAVPNFSKFRLRLILGVAAIVLLIVGWALAFIVLPKAQVIVRTDTTTTAARISFNASKSAKSFDLEKAIVPAKNEELKKTDTEKVPATGQKDVGEKASGTMAFINCNKDDKLEDRNRLVPAGTGVSSGGFTFITQEEVAVPPSGYTGDACKADKTSTAVKVVAQKSGDSFNLSARGGYAVAGFASITGTGSAMTGGTSKVVKVVSSSDVDGAKQKLQAKAVTAQDELIAKHEQQGLFGLRDSFTASEPAISSVPKVDEEASEVSVSQAVTYSMLGVTKSDLEKLLKKEVDKTIDTTKEEVRGYGLEKALMRITERPKNGDVLFSLDSSVVTGSLIREEDIRADVAGKKKNEAISAVQSRPGVKEVEVSIGPFWVSKIPTKPGKVKVVLEQRDSGSRSINP